MNMKEATAHSFHDTLIPVLSLSSDREAKVFWVEKLPSEVSGHSKTPKSLPVLKQGFCHRGGKGTEVFPGA